MPVNPRDLAAILLGLGGAASGNPTGINTFMQNDIRAQQQRMQQDHVTRQNALADAQLQNMQADNTRADQQRQDAMLARRMQFVQGLPSFLGDEEIDSPEAFTQRLSVAERLGKDIGVESGFLRTFQPTPDKFTQRRAKKKLAEIAKTYSADQMSQMEQAQETGQPAVVFEFDGQRIGLPQLRQMAGVSGFNAQGQPASLPKAKPAGDASLDRQALEALERGDMAAYQRIIRVKKDLGQADDRPPVVVTMGGSGLSPQQVTAGSALRDDYRAQSKDYFTLRDAYERVQASAQDPSAAGDMALLYAYMKVLDPGSVVRETEFATAARSGSLPQQVQAFATKLINGQRLTPEQRHDFLSRAKNLYDKSQSRQNKRIASFKKIAQDSGIPDSLVIVDAEPADEAPTTRGTAPQNPYRPHP